MKTTWILAAILAAQSSSSELNVLHPQEGDIVPTRMLRDYLRVKVHTALDKRLETLEGLETPEQIAAYQHRLKSDFLEHIGPLPERTPLNARIMGRLPGNGYRVEKILFESRPGFWVSSLLYLPPGDEPRPGILFPCGHSENGKAAEAYQQTCILLAKNGFVVLCYDPIGQGERKQLIEADGTGQYRATSEHMVEGVAPILLGHSLATYMIWDAMRGIDYLRSRPEVDPERIGCTGNSGGGNLTSYLMALDDRIDCAAPGCFITTTRRKNDSPGPGDAEQNIHGQIAFGMDHPDYLIMQAPSPVLICSATKDFVPIAGSWEAFRQAKRIYTTLGFSERVDLIETNASHGYTTQLRVGATRWMRRWLSGIDDAIEEAPSQIASDEDLQCTTTGQVIDLPSARRIFDLNVETETQWALRRKQSFSALSESEKRESVRNVIGAETWTQLPPPHIEKRGQIQRGAYTIDKIVLKPEPGILLSALLLSPDRDPTGFVLYVDGAGKSSANELTGPVEQLVQAGNLVLTVDLRGCGETKTDPWRYSSTADYLGHNAAEFFIAYMLGESFVGMRVNDILSSVKFLQREIPESVANVSLIATGEAGIPALHAAALEPQLFGSVELNETLHSWTSVVQTPLTKNQLINTVHGALRHFDLPDLHQLVGLKKIRIHHPQDAAGRDIVGTR